MVRSLPLILALCALAAAAHAAPDEPRRPARVLLITSAELAPAWSDFARWKTRQGKRTEILSTEAIAARYPGADLQAKIRACVLEHVDRRGTRWVILGGDSRPGGAGVVPDRDTKHRLHGGRLSYDDIPTDLYYVTRASWDENGDGVFGEWSQDRAAMDYAPVAALGRVPLRSAAEVAAYTAKVIAYESRFPGGEAARTLLYTCAVPQANYKSDLLWERNLEPAWAGGRIQRFFVDRSPWDRERAGDFDLSPRNWIARLNAQAASKVHMHGHGHLPGWVLERHARADARAVASLRNRGLPLVMTTVSCFTGHFDSAQDPAICESMLRHAEGGAVAIVAPAREGVPVFHGRGFDPRDGQTQDGTTRLLTRFWVHGLERGLTSGEALAAAKAELAKDAARNPGYHWVLCELNLLGDPTLDLRARPVTPLRLQAPSRLAPGAQRVVVETDRAGLSVCLWQGEQVYALATTDERGRASLEVSPRAGQLSLSVSGPSLNTETRVIRVGAGAAPRPPRWFAPRR